MNTIARAAVIPAAALLLLAGCGTDEGTTSHLTGEPEPAYDTTVRDASAAWLSTQLTDRGVAHNREFGFDDLSLTADIGLGLHLAEAEEETVATTTEALDSRITEYVAPGFGTEVSAGSAAKALVLTELTGGDATALGRQGGTDLVAMVEESVTAEGPAAGRIADRLEPGNAEAVDYANVFGQSYAVWGLHEAGSEQAEAATSFLLEQQCAEGWFRITFTADPTAPDQGCDADTTAAADPDATALAVIALSTIEDPSPEVSEGIEKAATWLAGQQAADGSFSSATAPVANSNTTGLAGRALAAAGDTDAAESAAVWVAEHVVPCSATAGEQPLAAGAVAYDDAALRQASSGRVTAKSEGQFRLATAQALPLLTLLPEDGTPAGFEDC